MPELPEVETVRRSLAPRLTGDVIASVEVFFDGCVEGSTPEELAWRLEGRRILELVRRGKYLVYQLDDGASLVIHLRMTGRLILIPADPVELHLHTRALFRFRSGKALRFDDQRKFGRVMWFRNSTSLKRRLALGVEPLDPAFTAARLGALVKGRKRPIKSLLLDQKLIAGLGNIYADEALFRARLLPWRPAGELSWQEVEALCAAIRDVLAEGLKYKGTTLRDYVDGDGRTGMFQERLQVYGREGEPCPRCGGAVARVVLGGRSSFHCPRCQV